VSFPRENTIQVAAVGAAADTVTTLILPNSQTGALPGDQTANGEINPVTANQRWRIRGLIASYGATPAAPADLVISDGEFTFTIPMVGPLPLLPLDIQCAPGAEVTVTLAAVAGAIGYLNLTAVIE
jgi:hypothetical protein